MPMQWPMRRQLFLFSFFAVFVFAVVGWVIYKFSPAPTCFDKKLNQSEERVDCGGECEPCVGNPEDLVTFWVRPFAIGLGRYEAAALIENPNLRAGARELAYKIHLFENNILVAMKEGTTFLNPRDKFLIFESNIATGERRPDRAQIEFREIRWKVFDRERPNVLVSSKTFEPTLSGNGRVRVVLKNQTLFSINDVYVSAALMDARGNALGVSASKVDRIGAEGMREVFFTWPHPFEPAPSNIEVFVRTNLTE